MDDSTDGRLDHNRLERAMSVFLSWQDRSDRESAPELLAGHPELHDLLEPLLEDELGATLDDGPAQPSSAIRSRRISDYRVVREIGRGGMGVVYEAHQESLDRRVALKVLDARWTALPQTIARFRREAGTVGRLRHPGIVEVHGVGRDGDVHWFAMELVEGRSLDAVVREFADRVPSTLRGADLLGIAPRSADGRTPGSSVPDQRLLSAPWPTAVARIVGEVAQALGYAHSQGVLHRDVKPSNVLLRTDGRALLVDFGLAREEALPAMTASGEFAGTPQYLAPEQVEGRSADQRSDVFSLGATLYELLTLRRAFSGTTEAEVLDAVRSRDPLDPRRIDPALPPDLVAVTMRALEKEPARRYPDVLSFAADLEAFADGRPVQARPISTFERIRRQARRHPARAAAVGAIALLVLALSGFGGWAIARQPEILAGRERLRLERIQDELEAGFAAHVLHDLDAAQRSFRQVLEIDPGNVYALTAMSLSGFLSLPESIALLDRYHTTGSEPRGLDLVRAELRRLQGRDDEAATLRESVGTLATATEQFIAGFVALPRADQMRGQAPFEVAMGHFHNAILRSEHANFIHYQYYALAASRVDGAEDTSRAITDAVLQLWPDRADALLVAGIAITYVDADRALQLFQRAVELEPDRGVLRRNLSVAYTQLGRSDDALRELMKAAELDPADHIAQAFLAMQLFRRGELDEAILHIEKAIEIAPHDGKHFVSAAHLYEKAGDPETSLAMLEQAIALDPGNPRAHRSMVGLHYVQRRFDGMVAEGVRWTERWPDDPKAWQALAKMCVEEPYEGAGQDLPRAHAAARRAVELDDGAVSWSLLAAVRAAEGDAEAAREAAAKARERLDRADPQERPAVEERISRWR